MRRACISLAFLTSVSLLSCGWDSDWNDRENRYSNFSKSEPSQGEESMEAYVELNVGTLHIAPGEPSLVYDLDLEYNSRAFEPRLEFRRDGKRAHLHFELEGRGKSLRRVGKSRLNLRLNPDTPLSLESKTGVGESQIDLSGMKINSLMLESGVGETKLSMLSPNRMVCDDIEVRCGVGSIELTGLGNFGFKQFKFKGGVGGATLEFSGNWAEVGDVDIEVGVGGVEIRIPRDMGAEIRVSKSFLSGVSTSDGFRKEGDTYVSENLERVDKVVHFRISAGIGGVDIRWI